MNNGQRERRFDAAQLETIGALFCELSLRAGRHILDVRHGGVHVRHKADRSPVSEADVEAEAIILDGLAGLGREFPVVSEEAVAAGHVPEVTQSFILVDPLDGTREFLAGNNEFTVNIALIADRAPVLGVVYAPVTGKLWFGGSPAGAAPFAFSTVCDPQSLRPSGPRTPIAAREPAGERLHALASRSHLEQETSAYLDRIGAGPCQRIGSSVKFCLLAEGGADIYPRYSTTMEWDTAAGDAVLRGAGGMVFAVDGKPLTYGKAGYRNQAFLACGRIAPGSRLLAAFVTL